MLRGLREGYQSGNSGSLKIFYEYKSPKDLLLFEQIFRTSFIHIWDFFYLALSFRPIDFYLSDLYFSRTDLLF